VTRSALPCGSSEGAEHHSWETHITPPRSVPDQVSGEKDAGSGRPNSECNIRDRTSDLTSHYEAWTDVRFVSPSLSRWYFDVLLPSGSRTMMSDLTPYPRMARCSILESRRQPVPTDAVSYNRFVMRNAVAEDARDGEH
jgi:hypothetical protein